MKKELPKKYKLECYFPHIFGINYIETSNENSFYYLKNFKDELKINSKKDCYLNLFNIKHEKEFNKLQTVPITYICDEYCLS